jgi:hypothetical protein
MSSKKWETRYADAKEFVFRSAVLRVACYLLLIAAMLFYWLTAAAGEISFVYNGF